ncbi:trace amine-associated receptor 7g-like [Stylophora pistillata]|uniref:trace amine-associated receptor 7g-like n=1 Tax=Stylophora pistillata TaxID=50429 RepID=UPI000C053191|nr:trace amine-associated receptor 7g-like [Stylophora pistillata]
MEEFILHYSDNQTNTVARLRTCLLANCVVNAIGLFIASFGNALILLSIWLTKSLHSPSNTLLFALSLTDLLVGTVTQPLYIISRVYFLVTGKDGPLALQTAFDAISGGLSGVSFITATLISVDRYLVLLLHLRYRCLVTNRKIFVFILGSWLLSGIWGFIWTQDIQLFYFLGFVSSTTCFTVILLMYCKIYRVIRRHRQEINIQKRLQQSSLSITSRISFLSYTRSVVNTFIVCFLLFLCYFPYLCTAAVIELGGLSTAKKISLEVSGTIIFVNSSLNPFVYFWRVKEFRSAIKSTLRRLTNTRVQQLST